MNEDKIDEVLKQKLKNKIQPPNEFQNTVIAKINEQKYSNEKHKEKKNSFNKYKKLKYLISIAAVFVLLMTGGIFSYINMVQQTITIAKITGIEPTKLSSGIIQNDSEFIITAEGEKINEKSIAQCLYIEPALDYSITKIEKNKFKLLFKQNIPDNTIVKLQYVKNKITEDSWAYQTQNNLSIVKTYPTDKSSYASPNTAIEVYLSYANVENFEQHVSISPNVEGVWKHEGKIWRFEPQNNLEEKKYTITIDKGISAGEKTLEKDYTFAFSVEKTGEAGEYYYLSNSIDKISNCMTEEPVKIYYFNYKENTSIANVEIRQFESTDNFIKYLSTQDYSEAKSLGNYKFKTNKEKSNYEGFKSIELTNSLPEGYYVAIVKDSKGRELLNCPVQVNSLSASAIATERDLVVWVAEKDNFAENINVEYLGQNQKTGKEGTTEFKNIANNSEKMEYVKIGNTENKLVVGIYNYTFSNYPTSYLYTDRLLYKNTDTINIWGFVPRQLFFDKIEDEFYITLNDNIKKKVNVDENGSFECKIDINNYADDQFAYINLYYKDENIAFRQISIENYELQNYNYNIKTNSNYAFVGEKYEFDVEIEHITGLKVANKEIRVVNNGRNYTSISNEEGIAHFSIDIDVTEDLDTIIRGTEIQVFNDNGAEYNTANEYIDIYVINRTTYTDSTIEENNCKVNIYKLKKENIGNIKWNLEELYDGIYDTDVTVNFIENVRTRYLAGTRYNEYTKEYENVYEYNYTTNKNKYKTISTKGQEFSIDIDTLPMKNDTDDIDYSYQLEYIYKDTEGKEVQDVQYIYKNYEYTYEGFFWGDETSGLWETGADISDIYFFCRYKLTDNSTTNKFSIGDTINFTLKGIKDNKEQEITNEGKLLKVVLQQDIKSVEIVDPSQITHTFTNEDFPGCKITSIYFYNGKFYRMPTMYYDFDEKDRTTNIEITADKEKYSPNEDVTVTIKSDKNSVVNVSVVNEAVFKVQGDMTNIVETIYTNKKLPVYTYSSYNDVMYDGGGEGGGGDDQPRGNFEDTVCFKTVQTDSNGIAKVTFKLPDNVTTYRVTAHSANKDLYVGVNYIDITSTLDFFVQSTEPRNVKNTDDLVLNATSISNEITDVNFDFNIKELNRTISTTAKSNQVATVNFGKLDIGTYHVVITGKDGVSTDSITYAVNIIGTTQEVKTKTTVNLNEQKEIKPSKNPITLEIYNKNMKQYLDYINFVENTIQERLDIKIAYAKIQEIKAKYYGTESKSNGIDISQYTGGYYLKNLNNGAEDIVLTALVKYYAKENSNTCSPFRDIETLGNDTNLFEIYLLAAANQENVLTDLIYLKEEKDISNYNKLLLTISFEFLGDFQNAKELYNKIDFTAEETNEYKSLIAIAESFINRNSSTTKINELISERPSDEYLRFAILSFFENNAEDISKNETVTISCNSLNETITVNGMQVKTYTINNKDLETIKFDTNSKDLEVTYYYQTLMSEIEDSNIVNDVKLSINGELKTGNTVMLNIKFTETTDSEIRIALPNSLRLAQNYKNTFEDNNKNGFYLINNKIDYITLYKLKDVREINIPLLVTLDGEYVFENVVQNLNNVYHISNSLEMNIK